jgi:hypothetical protein
MRVRFCLTAGAEERTLARVELNSGWLIIAKGWRDV